MSKFLHRVLVLFATAVMPLTMFGQYQLPDPGFEDWSGTAFDGQVQNKYWHASNVEQSALGMSFKFNFAHKEAGRNGGSCIMAQDQTVGAAGITETSPSYYSLGYGWQYLEGLSTGTATAGTKGGLAFTHRPDSISVWIKRTGANWDKEDFHILFYSWTGTAKGKSYKNKNGGCTNVSIEDEESDVRIALDGNQCSYQTAGGQVAEGWIHERRQYTNWTNVRIPIYYMNDNIPAKCNVIFSASNYPNYRSNSGLYEGNSLYVDDVELIYSSKIQKLVVGGKEWKGFDPNNTGVQVYSVPEGSTTIPSIEAFRGIGSLSNVPNQSTTKTVHFSGRKLSGSEITIVNGTVGGTPTKITVRAEDGSSTTVYNILFQAAKSSNAKLASISYTYTDKDNHPQTTTVAGFNPSTYNYNVELPYGAKGVPTVSAETQEDEQAIIPTQATSVPGQASLKVIAADGTSTATYRINFSIGQLADNTLAGIKVNGTPIPGFSPTQAVYKVSLPTSTTTMPTVQAVSAYAPGEQTIVYNAPSVIDGGTYTISVTTPGNTVPKVYKLNFKLEASSYTYLQDLRVVRDNINLLTNFEPTQTTYYFNLPLGTTALPAISWTAGDEFQTIAKTDLGAGVVDGTVRVTVTAGNGDQTVYKLVFTTEKSDRSTLNGITIGGTPLDGFDPDVLVYNYALPVGTTVLPEIVAVPGDEFQTIAINPAGVNGKTRITVTAGDGSTSVYQISFSVETYSVNTLRAIYLNGTLIDGFDPNQDEYWVNMPQGTVALPVVTYELENEQLQTASVRAFSGLNGDYKITVRPQGGASRTYILHFSVTTSGNNRLEMIYLNGTPLEGFHPDTLHYIDSLPEGVSAIPNVTFVKGEATQRVLSVQEGKQQIITVTAESGAKRVYVIDFVVRASENAFLEMIYLNGDSLEGFGKQTLEYHIPLQTATCPIITVDAAPGQQVTITAPYAAGTAKIKVQPESGSANMYLIHFDQSAPTAVQLTAITVNGVALSDFQPTKLHYQSQYSLELPDVQGVGQDGQTIQVLWKDSVAYLHVTDSLGAKAMYDVTFSRILSTNTRLEGIYADGVLISGFDATQLNYEYNLPAGSTYPEVSYKAAEQAQVVFFGQLEDGKWGISVLAENGSTATYTVRYTIAKYSDPTLQNLEVQGKTLSFNPNTHTYVLTLDEGAPLPLVTVTPREQQTVVQYNEDDRHQRVIVYAESGDTASYTITYNRVLSSDTHLKDILIDGVSLQGFDPDVLSYVDSIPLRSKFVPNVFPVAALSTQTVTTYFSRPDGVTRIHVEAQNGDTRDYTIAFPVVKSNNTQLGDLYLDSEEAEISFKPNQTDYTVELPFSATSCPKMVYEKDEQEQRIDVISRPLGQTSQIIVTAENGEQRIYNILFKREVLNTKNVLSMLRIKELDQELSLKDKTKRVFDVDMPFGSRSLTVEYEKSYNEQTVFIQPGGVHHPTIITVKANNDTIADEVYRIIPEVSTQNPAVLASLSVNDKPLADFDMNRFSYVVLIDTIPMVAPIVIPEGYNHAIVTPIIVNHKHWQALVSKDGFTNTYDIWFYYTHDVVPNADFNNWTTAANNDAPKPTGWNCLADYVTSSDVLGNGVKLSSGTHTFGQNEEVVQVTVSGTNRAVQLNSKQSAHEGNIWAGVYGGDLGGYLPAWITLGTISGTLQEAGGSSFYPQGGITYRNTPDILIVRAKTGSISSTGNKNRIVYQLTGNGSKELEFSTEANTDYKVYSFNLAEANSAVTAPTQLNIILNSFYKESMSTKTQGSDADLTIDYLRFSYNHALTSMTVDGIDATKSGNAFTATLTDPERIELPVLAFTGEVADQAQDVVWSAPTKDADFETRNATIRNWAENGADYTDYTLSVKRPLDTKNQLTNIYLDTVPLIGFSAGKYAYTVALPAARRNIPDIQPIPGSSLQSVTALYNDADSTMTITVTPEKGSAKTYTITFSTTLSNDTTLANIVVDGLVYDPEQKTYELTANTMPLISFEKRSDLQVVTLNNGVISVTAEDGVSTGTYTITYTKPAVVPNGVLTEFEMGGNIISGFGGANMTRVAAKPTEAVIFKREQDNDSIVFVQNETAMEWSVPGATKVYTWTYQTESSDNADLADITLDGISLSDFMPGVTDYDLTLDSMVILEPLAAEEAQTLQTTCVPVVGGVDYTTVVTAEDATTTKTYHLQVRRPVGHDATLAGILLDSVMIDGFRADSMNYAKVLPVGAVKTAQPKMPSVTYLAGHPGQKISVEQGQVNGNPTIITVESEDGAATNYYYLSVTAQKSHCSDLTGITVNGEAIDYFEPGRHFYSVSVNTENIEVDYTTDDRFQTVTTTVESSKTHQFRYTLHVMAEDSTTSDYMVEIYVENQSSDAQLANIKLDGEDFDHFLHSLNPDLVFDGGNNNYDINLPSGTPVLPEVSAQLKMDGQQVEIIHRPDSILLDVTAVDGTTHNIYHLHFLKPMSKNADLSMIFLDGDSLKGFEPTYYFYQISMPEGVHTMPEVAAQKGEPMQTLQPVEIDLDKLQATIKVQAEDPSVRENTYVVVFHITESNADTLLDIYEDGKSMNDFEPRTMYYTKSLPVGTLAFPDLSWQEVNDLQTITMDTVEFTQNTLIRQIKVTAESGKKNIYTVSYTIEKSSVDTLQMLFVDQKQLPGFKASTTEYFYQLTAAEATALNGQLPEVDYIKGDESQNVMVSQVVDSLAGKSLGYKSLVTVTAATGKTTMYTIHYPVELSTDATLNMINVGTKPLANYDAERFIYKLEIEMEAAVPVVSVIKKEEAQVYEINVLEDTVKVVVWAESLKDSAVYTLSFERLKSKVTDLRDIILVGADSVPFPTSEFPYRPEIYSYTVKLPYDRELTPKEQLPDIRFELYDEEQQTDTAIHVLPNGDIQVDVTVTAPNGEDQAIYSIIFQFVKPSDAMLASLGIRDEEFADFRPSKTEYVYAHPYGTDSTAFFTADDVTYVLSDSLATIDSIYMDENNVINVVTLAQDGRTSITYLISQIIAKDGDNALAWITVNGETLPGFDPEETFYTFYVFESDAPTVDAAPRSENAEIDLGRVLAGDTCRIICTAADGTDRYYYIYFAITSIDPSVESTADDVLVKPLGASHQLFIATIRQGVYFALYDQYGKLVYHQPVPPANPNDVEIVTDQNGIEHVNNISNLSSGLLVDVIPGQIYYYAFYNGDKTFIQMLKGARAKRLKSGKIIIR